ncbi:MAG: branched-chain amino acid ABC transporter permease [Candidatus Accumulibacter sp.]|jgi:ABC-type branched-subunit amino acid transport system permease subunit|nr:branched-chain amino acid ABC transporter permease [Accumulibacter sp.]
MTLPSRSSVPALLAAALVVLALAGALLGVEEQAEVAGLFAVTAAAVALARYFRLAAPLGKAASEHPNVLGVSCIVGVLILAAVFREDHFPLLLLASVLLYATACLGLNIQFGYVGIVNFAGASFFGIGGYTAAVLANGSTPHLFILALGGVMASLISCVLLLPVLRTRGHYAALVTIAFATLFRSFLEVNDTLGGPQGLKIPSLRVFGWDLGEGIAFGDVELSFYANYVFFALVLCALAFVVVRRLERSWMGVAMDMVRIDEVAASVYGISVARQKIFAFMLGNLLVGVAGAVYGMMTGYVAPNNFTFADSLILVSMILLGGVGNVWGIFPAAALILILPEKLQFIQEYRFLLYGIVIIFILLFRSQGLLPRGVRRFFPEREADA